MTEETKKYCNAGAETCNASSEEENGENQPKILESENVEEVSVEMPDEVKPDSEPDPGDEKKEEQAAEGNQAMAESNQEVIDSNKLAASMSTTGISAAIQQHVSASVAEEDVPYSTDIAVKEISAIKDRLSKLTPRTDLIILGIGKLTGAIRRLQD